MGNFQVSNKDFNDNLYDFTEESFDEMSENKYYPKVDSNLKDTDSKSKMNTEESIRYPVNLTCSNNKNMNKQVNFTLNNNQNEFSNDQRDRLLTHQENNNLKDNMISLNTSHNACVMLENGNNSKLSFSKEPNKNNNIKETKEFKKSKRSNSICVTEGNIII